MTRPNTLFRLLPLLAVLLPQANATDSFGFSATAAVPYSYINIAASGASVLAGYDDSAATLALPFPFSFYGVTHSSLCVSTNGLIAFGGCVPSDFTNLDLTVQSPAGNRPLIAPFWMDLTFSQAGAGSIVYQTLGAAPNRQFVVQWNNAAALNTTGLLNFQVILSEDGRILFQYQNVESGSAAVNRGASATVAIRGASGHSNGYRTQWSYRAPVLKNGLAIQFTSSLTVSIDLKPGDFPNTINLSSRGTIPLAVLSSPAFDATKIDPASARLSGAPIQTNPQGRPNFSLTDVNGDGLLDFLAHFDTQKLNLAPTATQVVLDGRTFSGQAFRGVDSVRIVP
jgi:hypothetical protein